jgi:hypothetical protein
VNDLGRDLIRRTFELANKTGDLCFAVYRLVVPHLSQTIHSTIEAINAGLQSLKADGAR